MRVDRPRSLLPSAVPIWAGRRGDKIQMGWPPVGLKALKANAARYGGQNDAGVLLKIQPRVRRECYGPRGLR